ncbi:serine hydrolase [Candidatus Saccharibacteria bacterium]|nr:serine hydrolase [Candidatus Saccharibacteria bacterium]
MHTSKRLIKDINFDANQLQRVSAYTPTSRLTSYPRGGLSSPPPRPPRKKKRPIKSITLLLISLIVAGVLLKFSIFESSGTNLTSTIKSVSKQKAAPKEIEKINTAALKTDIDTIISKYPKMQIGVSFSDIKTSAKLNLGAEDTFRAASTTKLITAALFLQQTQSGQRSLDQLVGGSSARIQLKLLIENSDNAAWEAFDAILGGQALDEYARQIGMLTYTSSRNRTTPSDIAVLLKKLYRGELLNQENTNLLLSHMRIASEKQYILAVIPESTKAYHKAGYLADRAHDAAIIDDGKRPFVLVIFSMSENGQYSYIEGAKMMHEITTAVLSAYLNIGI